MAARKSHSLFSTLLFFLLVRLSNIPLVKMGYPTAVTLVRLTEIS